MRDSYGPASVICALIANVHRDQNKKSEPFTPADFLPGAKSEEDEWIEFIEKVQRGDKFKVDPQAAAEFRRKMVTTFGNVRGSEVTNVGPSGRPEPVRTNAIAGEGPRRGLN